MDSWEGLPWFHTQNFLRARTASWVVFVKKKKKIEDPIQELQPPEPEVTEQQTQRLIPFVLLMPETYF